MRQVQVALPIALTLVLGRPTQVTADPISVTFDVRVEQRVVRTTQNPNDTFTAQPFDLSFALQMTFDPAQGTPEGTYGLPSFSTPPLPIPTAPPGVPLSTSGFTQHEIISDIRIVPEPSLVARAERQTSFVGEHSGQNAFFLETLTLLSRRIITSPPVITAETFPLHLGMPAEGGEVNFFYGSCLAVGEGCESGASFHEQLFSGFATLREGDEPGVIPEPTTLVLVGSGLFLAARKLLERRPSQQ